jgi:hypothetical protein
MKWDAARRAVHREIQDLWEDEMNRLGHLLVIVAATVSLHGVAHAQFFSGDWAKELQHDQPAPKTASQKRVEAEILGLQAVVRAKTLAKDYQGLQAYFMPDFTMTHGAGAIHDRELRTHFIVNGNGGYEAMVPDEQTIRVLDSNAAVSIANNSLKAANGETAWIRYMIVYERGAPNVGYKGWREAAAHVIGVFPPKNRDPRFGQ